MYELILMEAIRRAELSVVPGDRRGRRHKVKCSQLRLDIRKTAL